jgi:hypothetical protein
MPSHRQRRPISPQRRGLGGRSGSAVLISLALALCAGPAAVAQPHAAAVVTPSPRNLVGEAWAQLYALPAAENPLLGNGDPCLTLSPNAVEVISGNHCTLESGTAPLVGLGSAWSNVEDPFPADEAAQRAVALAADRSISEVHVTVDDGPSIDIRTPRFELFSPQRTVSLPDGNILGVPPQTVTLTAHGWFACVRSLRPGPHAIVVDVVRDGERLSFAHSVTVTRSGR